MRKPYSDSLNAVSAGVGNVGSIIAKTYALLAVTLGVSAMGSIYGMHSPFVYEHRMALMLVSLILLFAIRYTGGRESPFSIPLVFAFAGCMGAVMGPAIGYYLHTAQGPEIVTEAMVTTVGMFVGLSIYGAMTRRNFSHLAGFLITGLIIGIIVSVVNMLFLHIGALQLAVAGIMVLVFSGLIVYDTQRLVQGGIQHPVMLVVSLYLDIINLFMALLQIFGARE